jgi:hypothetical protein
VPTDAAYDQRLAEAVFAAMYGAGELQELLDDPDVGQPRQQRPGALHLTLQEIS